MTRQLRIRYGWPASLSNSLASVWDNQHRFVSWGRHVHPDPLQSSAQPEGDPLGCVFMSLWVLSGVRSVRFPGSFVTTYLDDRCVAASSHSLLFDLFESWVAWSRQVGLLESVSKTVAVGRRAAESRKLKQLFPAEAVGSWIRSYNGVRGLTEVETARIDSACRVAFLLRAVRFPLSSLFALSRASFVWVVRWPTWDVPYCTNRLLIVILKNRICVCKDRVSVFNCQDHGQLLGTSSYQRVCVPKTALVEERVWPRLASRRRVWPADIWLRCNVTTDSTTPWKRMLSQRPENEENKGLGKSKAADCKKRNLESRKNKR